MTSAGQAGSGIAHSRRGAPWRVALCAGAFAAAVLTEGNPVALLAIAAAGVAGLLVVTATRRWLGVVALCASCALGGVRGAGAAVADTGPGSVSGHIGSGAVVVRGTVADGGVPGRDDTVVVDAGQLAAQGHVWDVTGAVVVQPVSPADVGPGDRVEVQGPALRSPARHPGALSAAALERVGVSAVMAGAAITVLGRGGPSPARLADELRRALSATVVRVVPEPAATLLLGIAFGVHGRLPSAIRTPLQDAGLIHIVAVSGLKVVIVAGLVGALAAALQWSRRRRTVATVVVILVYVVVSGAGAAAIRSALMVGAGMLLARDGRRPHSFALLALCAAAMLAVDPVIAGDVGFQLSFLGTAGILLLAAPLASRLPGPRLLIEPLAVTAAAQMATVPVAAGTFGVLSLIGPLANALVLPLLPLAIVTGGAGALAGSLVPVAGAALGWLPLQVAALITEGILAVASAAAALPFAALHLQVWPVWWEVAEAAGLGVAAVAWARTPRWPRPQRLAMSAALAVLAFTAGAGAATAAAPALFRVTVLDVGNATAVLLRPPGGGAVLVDGGADSAVLLAALGRALSPFERHLDSVVLTATDRATSAALAGLLGHYDIGTLLVSQPLPSALQTVAARFAGTGTHVVPIGAAAWGMAALTARCVPASPDAAPCVLQVHAGHAALLVTGNLAQVAQDELAAVQRASLRTDLMVGPTTTAPSAALLDHARPSLLAVPARRAPPGLAPVRAAGAEVSVTGADGDLEYQASAGEALTLAG